MAERPHQAHPVKIVACVIDDGRPAYLAETVAAMNRYVHPIDVKILINDCAEDRTYRDFLLMKYPNFDEQVHHNTRRGLGGAVESAWRTALEHDADYVLHVEDDMVIVGDVDLLEFVDHLKNWPHLAQVALNRRPLNDAESSAISVVAATPERYKEFSDGTNTWCETDFLFVFSPSLIPRHVIEYALANTDIFLEREITDALWANGYKSCYWGGQNDMPLCHHVGTQRSANYRW